MLTYHTDRCLALSRYSSLCLCLLLAYRMFNQRCTIHLYSCNFFIYWQFAKTDVFLYPVATSYGLLFLLFYFFFVFYGLIRLQFYVIQFVFVYFITVYIILICFEYVMYYAFAIITDNYAFYTGFLCILTYTMYKFYKRDIRVSLYIYFRFCLIFKLYLLFLVYLNLTRDSNSCKHHIR